MNTRQDWIVSVYKMDKRHKSGERLVSKYPFNGMDRDTVERELRDLAIVLYPKKSGWRFDIQPAMKVVKNFMTGELIQIPTDTPRSCDPSSETYWSS